MNEHQQSGRIGRTDYFARGRPLGGRWTVQAGLIRAAPRHGAACRL